MSFQNKVTLKIGMLGNVQVGKTSLMVKYVDDKFDEDYNMTLGQFFFFPFCYDKMKLNQKK